MGKWLNYQNLIQWTLKMLTYDKQDNIWCVGTGGNMGKLKSDTESWDGQTSNWTLNWLAFDSSNAMWCVGTDGNVGKWDSSTTSWISQPAMSKWTLKMIAFDSSNTMWCVGTQGNVGKWDTSTTSWVSQPTMSTWTLKMIAFDDIGGMWCVGADGNVGIWNTDTSAWVNQGNMGNWSLNMLTFGKKGTIWGVGTQNNVGTFVSDSKLLVTRHGMVIQDTGVLNAVGQKYADSLTRLIFDAGYQPQTINISNPCYMAADNITGPANTKRCVLTLKPLADNLHLIVREFATVDIIKEYNRLHYYSPNSTGIQVLCVRIDALELILRNIDCGVDYSSEDLYRNFYLIDNNSPKSARFATGQLACLV